MKDKPQWLSDWFSSLLRDAEFCVGLMPLDQSEQWSLTDGKIVHRSGRFFQISGFQWPQRDNRPRYQPLIDQSEIGTLGFVMRNSPQGPELLVHGKIEPGNVGGVQLAPSCQATASNTARVHGGDPPPYSHLFVGLPEGVIHQSLQSEQGTRFLAKRNRNVLIEVNSEILLTPAHRWTPMEQILELVDVDYAMNSDARSALVSNPWSLLVRRSLFTREKDTFSEELAGSFRADYTLTPTIALKRELSALRARIPNPTTIRLDNLPGWRLNSAGLSPESGEPFCVRHIRAHAIGREVHDWDQPIIDSPGQGLAELWCGRGNDVLFFLFKAQVEPGLFFKVELGPSAMIEPGDARSGDDQSSAYGKTVVEVLQSDEGGRFYQDKSLYRIRDVGQVYDVPDGCWITLRQVQELVSEGGWFTNEARSVLSLLLRWL